MKDQVLFIGTYSIPAGKLDAYIEANQAMTEFVRANEPRMILFGNYVNAEGTEATTIQLHPDSASLEYHMEVGRKRIGGGMEIVQVKRIDLYGEVSERVVQQIRRISEASGNWQVSVKKFLHGYATFEPQDG